MLKQFGSAIMQFIVPLALNVGIASICRGESAELAATGQDQSDSSSIDEMASSVRHVVVVIFENADYQAAIQQPFFARLGQEGALLTNFFAETHPSQPNYIALIAGDMLGVHADSAVTLDANHLGDLIEAHGKSWKVYAEGWPGNCFTGLSSGNFVRKHVPFVSFRDVQTDATRCARIVDASMLSRDIAAGTLPDFALYIPNINNDGHNTSVAFASQWYQGAFGPLIANPQFADGTLLISTFDEGSRTGNNQIYASFWGPMVRPGTQLGQRYDHYSLLRTIEDLLEVGNLGRQDASAQPIVGWQ